MVFEKFFTDFVPNNFPVNNSGNQKEYEISPGKWSDKIMLLNVIFTATNAVLVLISVLVTLYLTSKLFEIEYIGTMKFYKVQWTLSIVSSVAYLYLINSKPSEFIRVPQGNIGVIYVLGNRAGGMDIPYHTTQGDFRDSVSIPFFGKIFDIFPVPIMFNNQDASFQNVAASGGPLIEGTYSYTKNLVNPFEYADRELATKKESIDGNDSSHNLLIEDISLQVLNNTFDDHTVSEMYNSKDGAKTIKDSFQKEFLELKKRDSCICSEKNLFGKAIHSPTFSDSYYINGTGLNVAFQLKTHIVMDKELLKSLNRGEINEAEGEAEVIAAKFTKTANIIKAKGRAIETEINAKVDAEAEALKVEKVGDAQNEVEKKRLQITDEMFQKAYQELRKDPEITEAAARQEARAIAGSMDSEISVIVGGPDGKQLNDQIGGLLSVFAAKLAGMNPKERESAIKDLKDQIQN